MRQSPSSRCDLKLNLCGDMKCISGAKIPPSGEVSVYYNSVSQDAIADIQAVSSISTKIVEKLFMASNLG